MPLTVIPGHEIRKNGNEKQDNNEAVSLSIKLISKAIIEVCH